MPIFWKEKRLNIKRLHIKRLILPLTAGLILLTGCGYDVRTDRNSGHLQRVALLERAEDGNGTCMVVRSNGYEWTTMTTGKYVSTLKVESDEYGNAQDPEFVMNLELYNIETAKMYAMPQKSYETAIPDGRVAVGSRIMLEDNGEWYIGIAVTSKDSEVRTGYLLIDMDDGKITEFVTPEYVEEVRRASAPDEEDREYQRKLDIFKRTTTKWDGFNAGFLDVNTKSEEMTNLEKGDVEVGLNCYRLPKENKALYSKFPGLKTYRGREDCVVIFHLKDWTSPEEIAALLLEDGEEVSFQSLWISSDESIDGQRHKIDSFEDWDKWYKPEEVLEEPETQVQEETEPAQQDGRIEPADERTEPADEHDRQMLAVMDETSGSPIYMYVSVDMDQDGQREMIGAAHDSSHVFIWYCSSDLKSCYEVTSLYCRDNQDINVLEQKGETHVVVNTYEDYVLGSQNRSFSILALHDGKIELLADGESGTVYRNGQNDIVHVQCDVDYSSENGDHEEYYHYTFHENENHLEGELISNPGTVIPFYTGFEVTYP